MRASELPEWPSFYIFVQLAGFSLLGTFVELKRNSEMPCFKAMGYFQPWPSGTGPRVLVPTQPLTIWVALGPLIFKVSGFLLCFIFSPNNYNYNNVLKVYYWTRHCEIKGLGWIKGLRLGLLDKPPGIQELVKHFSGEESKCSPCFMGENQKKFKTKGLHKL